MTDEPNVEINMMYEKKKKLKSLQIRCCITCHTEVCTGRTNNLGGEVRLEVKPASLQRIV